MCIIAPTGYSGRPSAYHFWVILECLQKKKKNLPHKTFYFVVVNANVVGGQKANVVVVGGAAGWCRWCWGMRSSIAIRCQFKVFIFI